MKWLLSLALFGVIGGQAMAADLSLPGAPPPLPPATYFPIAPIYSWSGFYIGGNLGAGWNNAGFSDSSGSTFSTSKPTTTFLGGAQFGANYEFGPSGVVVGAEAMFDWLSNANYAITATNTGTLATAAINNRWLTTATGKLGYAWDRVLFYGKGGFAWISSSSSGGTVGGVPVGISNNSADWGWTAGLGIEWAFLGNWSVRAEYDYVGLQNQTFGLPSSATSPFANDTINVNNRSIQMISAGLNYKSYGPGAW
jgi:outer membrane immunogenic protein